MAHLTHLTNHQADGELTNRIRAELNALELDKLRHDLGVKVLEHGVAATHATLTYPTTITWGPGLVSMRVAWGPGLVSTRVVGSRAGEHLGPGLVSLRAGEPPGW